MKPASEHNLRLLVQAFSTLLAALGTSMANIALPALASDFNASFATVQWVVISYVLAITLTSVIAGWLGDRLGYRPVLLLGLATFTLASTLCGFAPNLVFLITMRALQGMAAATLLTVPLALARNTATPGKTGQIMGLLGSMSAIGTALGPSLGGALVEIGNWRLAFLAMASLGAITMWLAVRSLPKLTASAAAPHSFDFAGLVTLAATLSAYTLAMTVGAANASWFIMLLGLAAVSLLAFVLMERRATHPLVRLSLFNDMALSVSLATNACVAMVMMATLLLGPFYLGTVVKLSPVHIGLVMAVGPLISMLSGVPAGVAVDRWSSRSISLAGLSLLSLGALALAVLPYYGSLVGYIASIAVLTPGYQLFQAANNTAVMLGTRPDERGVVSGMLSLSRNIGLVSGASAIGAVFVASSSATVSGASPKALVHGMFVVFMLAAILIAVMALLQSATATRVNAASGSSSPARE